MVPDKPSPSLVTPTTVDCDAALGNDSTNATWLRWLLFVVTRPPPPSRTLPAGHQAVAARVAPSAGLAAVVIKVPVVIALAAGPVAPVAPASPFAPWTPISPLPAARGERSRRPAHPLHAADDNANQTPISEHYAAQTESVDRLSTASSGCPRDRPLVPEASQDLAA